MFDKKKIYAINDGYGIIDFGYECECGNDINFVSSGMVCAECGFIIPDDIIFSDLYDELIETND